MNSDHFRLHLCDDLYNLSYPDLSLIHWVRNPKNPGIQPIYTAFDMQFSCPISPLKSSILKKSAKLVHNKTFHLTESRFGKPEIIKISLWKVEIRLLYYLQGWFLNPAWFTDSGNIIFMNFWLVQPKLRKFHFRRLKFITCKFKVIQVHFWSDYVTFVYSPVTFDR